MCCVGTKLAIRDCDYVVRRFVQSGAVGKERAAPYRALGIDCAEHLFARDNFESMLRVGKIVRTKDGLYYLKSV